MNICALPVYLYNSRIALNTELVTITWLCIITHTQSNIEMYFPYNRTVLKWKTQNRTSINAMYVFRRVVYMSPLFCPHTLHSTHTCCLCDKVRMWNCISFTNHYYLILSITKSSEFKQIWPISFWMREYLSTLSAKSAVLTRNGAFTLIVYIVIAIVCSWNYLK